MMRKIITLIVFIIILNIMLNINKNNVNPVFLENNENNYEIYNLLIEDLSVTTKNIREYFNGSIKIIGFYPKINNIYNYKLKNEIGYYRFNESNFIKDIDKFTSYYKDVINKYGITSEIPKIELNGIGIKQIKIYCSERELNYLLNKYPTIKILKGQKLSFFRCKKNIIIV